MVHVGLSGAHSLSESFFWELRLTHYKIAMSSTTPLAGRLAQIFSPRICIFVSAIIFAIGTLVTSISKDFISFIAGRAITGIGAAGNLPIAIVLVLELTGGKRRGLFIGILNTGFTIGVALGAVVAGALAGPLGWVFVLPYAGIAHQLTMW